MDLKRKNEVKKELDYCKETLEKEINNISNYQDDFFNWINSRKNIVYSMKEKQLPYGDLDEILNFSDYRNEFLVKKIFQMNRYLKIISKTINSFDSVDDYVDLQTIETRLIMMFVSLGLNLPTEIFGEPF